MFRENHKQEVKKLKDELDSVPKDQKKDALRQLKEEKDIQQAERVGTEPPLFGFVVLSEAC